MLLRYDDPEYVHQARVALRRVRSAIRLFDREHRDVPESLADELQWFARTLGEARDWDVITDQTLPSLAKALVSIDEATGCASRSAAPEAREKIRKAARSARYAALVLNGERWGMTPSPAGAELLARGGASTERSAEEAIQGGALFRSADTRAAPRGPHPCQAAALCTRFVRSGVTKQGPRAISMLCRSCRTCWAELNDAAVAIEVLPQLSRSAQIRNAAQKWLASIEPERVLDAESRLLKLSMLRAPWTEGRHRRARL